MTYKIKGFESYNLDEVTNLATDFINSVEMKGQLMDGWTLQTAFENKRDVKYIIVLSYYDEKEAR